MTKGNIALVTFDEENHKYFYEGKELKGVTGIIGKMLGKNFPQNNTTALACSYGSQVHKESERWIEEGVEPVMEEGKWVVEQLKMFKKAYEIPVDVLGKAEVCKYNAEVRVSDFEGTASNVDVVLHTPLGVILFDIKTGKFDRTYCTLQLNAYRVMYENCYNENVLGLCVVNTKAKRLFKVHNCPDEEILKLLEKNK